MIFFFFFDFFLFFLNFISISLYICFYYSPLAFRTVSRPPRARQPVVFIHHVSSSTLFRVARLPRPCHAITDQISLEPRVIMVVRLQFSVEEPNEWIG